MFLINPTDDRNKEQALAHAVTSHRVL